MFVTNVTSQDIYSINNTSVQQQHLFLGDIIIYCHYVKIYIILYKYRNNNGCD